MDARSSPVFNTFRTASNRAKSVTPFSGTLLALDPGETTGYALFEATETDVILRDAGQLETWPFEKTLTSFEEALTQAFPIRKEDEPTHHGRDVVLFESYNVYAHKLQQHTHSSVPTIQIIGCLQTLCFQRKLVHCTQTAQVGKGFCKDDKLKTWGFYLEGKKHARDATRHGCYFLLFGHKDFR